MMKNLKKLGNKITGDWYELIVIALLAAILYFVIKCKSIENLGTGDILDADAVKAVVNSKAVVEKVQNTNGPINVAASTNPNETQFATPAVGQGVGNSGFWPAHSPYSVSDDPNGNYSERMADLDAKYKNSGTESNNPMPSSSSKNYARGYPCDRN
jgi:hypothetical protein